MAEYIEREALLKDISESVVFTVKGDSPSLEIRGANKVIDRIKSAPTADVVSREVFEQVKWERDTALQTLQEHGIGLGQKVEHGEWIVVDDGVLIGDGKHLECSECGVWKKDRQKSNYCPNCGAKMDVATDTNVGGELKEGAENES